MANPSRPNTMATGETIDALRINEDFDEIYDWASNSAMHKDGTKSFTALPNGPAATVPTSDEQLANKLYVDQKNHDTQVYTWSGSADMVSATWATWIGTTVDVPAWATRAIVSVKINGILVTNTNESKFRIDFAGTNGTAECSIGLPYLFGASGSASFEFGRWHGGIDEEFDCTSSQGSTVSVIIEGIKNSGSGACRAQDASIKVDFLP